ncbi:MAG: LicD family protein, partial [Clostridia bacterium]|nr:LicD family protein [Clostridia bacterium]
SMEKAFDRVQRIAQRYNGNPDAHRLARTVFRKSEVVWYDQIFPVKRMPFNGMMLSCPNDYSPWTEKFTPELTKQIKSIQKVDLILLREFDRVCRKLNIGYFICGGSMLGYVRHGGFIPWDDDIDVGMLRADYDRFLKEGGALLDDRFFLQTRESDPKIPYLFSKIRMNNTEYITEYNEFRDFHKGICLDLFPFDALPNDEQEQKEFLAKVYSRVRKHNLACNKQIAEPVYDTPPKTFEDWFYRNLAKVHRMMWRMVSIKRTQKRYLKVATKYNAKAEQLGLNTVASFVPTYTFIDKDLLLPYQDIEFEGVPAKIPRCPEKFLEMQYSDFMQLPPLHQQLGHDLIRWSADIPELKEDDGKENA